MPSAVEDISIGSQLAHPPNVEQGSFNSPHEAMIIDIDVFEYEEILEPTATSRVACEGYAIILPDGKSPHTTYPFTLHAEKWYNEVVCAWLPWVI